MVCTPQPMSRSITRSATVFAMICCPPGTVDALPALYRTTAGGHQASCSGRRLLQSTRKETVGAALRWIQFGGGLSVARFGLTYEQKSYQSCRFGRGTYPRLDRRAVQEAH